MMWEDFLQPNTEMKLKQEEGWVSMWKPPDPREGPLYYAILGFDPGMGDSSRGKVESEESKDLYPLLRIQPLRGGGEQWLRGIFRSTDLRAAT